MPSTHSPEYERIRKKIAKAECVILDGGVSTEIERAGVVDWRVSDQLQWGSWALTHAPQVTVDVHRSYVDAGCDLISTNTWAVLSPPDSDPRSPSSAVDQAHWMDSARLGIRLARQAVREGGREGNVAVAFSINGDDPHVQRKDTLELLNRVFEEDPPDLILLETLSLIRDDITYGAIEMVQDSGIPVWLSFRRCRHGVCGVFGQHWGGPEGDMFGRAARRFESMDVGALLINCLPIDHIPEMIPWLRDFTDMPLGVYPNLGHYLDPGWKFDDQVEPDDYAALAMGWRNDGAQIIGGCCGVTAAHIEAAAKALHGSKPGSSKHRVQDQMATSPAKSPVDNVPEQWLDDKARSFYPLPFPAIVCDPGVFKPTQGTFLMWKHLFHSEVGRDKSCLDVGCGTGSLSVQLALNGATAVRAIDIQDAATANTMTNAFRNGVADTVTADVVDLYTFIPEKTYDIVVASLYQMPVNPFDKGVSHRSVDYWGRNLLDHLFKLLPDLLSEDGIAYVMQISILGQLKSAELLAESGLSAEVVDYNFFEFSGPFIEQLEQIRCVERQSDAYHFTFADTDVMVMYLLKITRK